MFLQLCEKWNNGGNGKKLDDHVSHKDYLTCKTIWNKFNMKNMSDYHNHYLKKDVCY